MTYLQLIQQIAEFLRARAEEYSTSGPVGYWFKELGEAGKKGSRILCEARVQGIDDKRTDPDVAKAYVLLAVSKGVPANLPGGGAQRTRIVFKPAASIVVYLGDAPIETKAKKVKVMRKAFRLRSDVRALSINQSTKKSFLVEMLAVAFAQCDLIDDSINTILCQTTPPDLNKTEILEFEKRRYVFDQLLARFVDPPYPGSYGRFKRQLRGIAITQIAPHTGRTRATLNDGDQEWKVVRNKSRSLGYIGDQLSVRDICQDLHVSRRTLYDWLKKGKIRVQDGMIPFSELGKIEELIRRQRKAKSVKYLVDQVTGNLPAKPDSIRRRIDRALAQGVSLEKIARTLIKECDSYRKQATHRGKSLGQDK